MDLNSDSLEKVQLVDFETQELIQALNASAEITTSDGSQMNLGRKRRLIDVDEDEDGSDVEITLSTKATQPRKQTSFGTGRATNSKKPMFQSTLDGGIGSSSKSQASKRTMSVKYTTQKVRNMCNTQGHAKKKVFQADTSHRHTKKKTQDEHTEVEDEFDEEETENQNKETRQWSDVLEDFVVIKKENGEEKAVCKHCKNEYAWSSHSHGTSGLRRHRDRCSQYPRNLRNMIITADAKIQARKYDHAVFRQLVAKTIIQHDLPYSYVEYERVRDTWKYLNADVKFISRNTAAADVFRFYENERDTLKRELASLPGRISLTSDLWSEVTHEGYMCVTAHYIDRNWKLNNKILTFCALPPPHSGMKIAIQLLESLNEWGIGRKVFSLTLDNATSNDSMQDFVKSQLLLTNDLLCRGEFFHVRCAAHILNLIVQDGLKVIGDSLHKIRESIKYITASESREILFGKCVDNAGLNVKAGLILDVQTRWNSTYHMLERALKYRDAFVNLQKFDQRNYKLAPTNEEWIRAEKICAFLKPFAQITRLMSGSNYPTSNLYFYQVFKIQEWLQLNEESEDEIVRHMVIPMKEKFDKYWDEVSDVFAMASAFDPRLKLTLAEYCFGELDMSSRDAKVENLRVKLRTLFESYDKTSKSTSPSIEPREVDQQNVRGKGPKGTFENYDDFFAFRKSSVVASGKTPLQAYLDETPLEMDEWQSLDILHFWKDNTNRYGELSAMACDLLSIPITTVASESSFSIGSRVLNKYRSRLLPKNVQALICARNWLKGFEAYENEGENDGKEETLPSFESIVNDEVEEEEA